MLRAATGQMLDLLATGNAGRDDLGLREGRLHCGRQPAVAECHRDFVMLALEAERPGHAAAARVDLLDLESRPAQHPDRRRRADERFLVAVAVQQRLPRPGRKAEREPPGALAQEKLLE